MGANETGPIGQSVRRREDQRFLTGAGQYTDDVTMAREAYVYFLRSPHAHAKISGIDREEARTAPGVLAIYTGDDLVGVNGLPCGWLITGTDGKPMNEPPHPVLAKGKVRHVGDPVAMIVAESLHQAKDAAELIVVDYEILPAVVNGVDALKPGRSTTRLRATAVTPGRSATRVRSTPPSPRRITCRRSTSSTTGSCPTRSSRARRWPRTAVRTSPTRST